MRFTPEERRCFNHLLKEYLTNKDVLKMKQYIQHGRITAYDHCKNVAETSFLLNRKLRLGADEKALVTGAMLHDFYLYDWHIDDPSHRLHGISHANEACKNAVKHFGIGSKEQAIIRSHMWPLTLFHFPSCREALIVSLVDKYRSAEETIFRR